MIDELSILPCVAYFVLAAHVFQYASHINEPKWLTDLKVDWFSTCFTIQCPVTVICLYYFAEENSSKYLASIILSIVLYDLGKSYATSDALTDYKAMFLMTCHHIAACLTHLFQDPVNCGLNALFFGAIWLPHSFPALETFLEKFGLLNSTFKKAYKWVSGFVTVVAYYYALNHYTPERRWFFIFTSSLQLIGRFFVLDNMMMIDWMGLLEFPGCGVAFCVFAGGYTLWSLLYIAMWGVFYYYFYSFYQKLTVTFPARLVRNAETEAFLKDYIFTGDQVCCPEQRKAIITWWGTMEFATEEKYPLVTAIIKFDNERVKELIASGCDINETVKEMYDTHAIGWAAAVCNLEAAVMLMQAGVDPYAKNSYEMVRVSYACRQSPGVARFFEELSDICYKYEKKKGNPMKPKKSKST